MFRRALPGKETFFGKVRGCRFRVFVLGPGDMRLNSFMPFFYGKLHACHEGTRISGLLRIHRFVAIFFSTWYAVVLAILTAIWWKLLAGHGALDSGVGILIVAILAFVTANAATVPWLVLSFGLRTNRDKEKALKRFIVATLEAREITTGEDG